MPYNFKRTVLITGATDGIGKALALELSAKADENFVIIHGRCKQKCQQTIEFLIEENKLKSHVNSNLDYVAADFSHFSDICRMAEEIKLRFPRLNVFVGSASILVPRKMNSCDGIELTLQVNHLSHFVLWNLLLPVLEKNAPSRIITVGSVLHIFNPIDWDDFKCEKGYYDKFLQFSRTQMMNHLATFYIHRLLFKHNKQFQVTANVVDADQQTESRLTRNISNHLNAFSASESYLNAHANGVQTLAKLVESPNFSSISGKYFDTNGKEIRKSADVGDVRLQNRLWETSEQLCRTQIAYPLNNNINNKVKINNNNNSNLNNNKE